MTKSTIKSPRLKTLKMAEVFHHLPTTLHEAFLTQDDEFFRALSNLPAAVEKILRRAFKYARLDIENDEHWKILTAMMAVALFAGQPGRAKAWTKKRYALLLADVEAIRRKGIAGVRSEGAICELLIKDKNRPYHHMAASTLRTKLQVAKKVGAQKWTPSKAKRPPGKLKGVKKRFGTKKPSHL